MRLLQIAWQLPRDCQITLIHDMTFTVRCACILGGSPAPPNVAKHEFTLGYRRHFGQGNDSAPQT